MPVIPYNIANQVYNQSLRARIPGKESRVVIEKDQAPPEPEYPTGSVEVQLNPKTICIVKPPKDGNMKKKLKALREKYLELRVLRVL